MSSDAPGLVYRLKVAAASGAVFLASTFVLFVLTGMPESFLSGAVIGYVFYSNNITRKTFEQKNNTVRDHDSRDKDQDQAR